jgi:peptide-methionine (S)-S-oxide reductase
MSWFGDSHKLKMPIPAEALPGREGAMPVPDQHAVNGAPLRPPYPAGTEIAEFGMGCFWGAEKLFWQTARRRLDRGRLLGRLHAQPDLRRGLHRPNRPHRDRPRRLRSQEGLVRRVAQALLGGARPDPGHAPGWRPGHAVPLGDPDPRRRPAARGRGVARRLPGEPEGRRPRHDHDRDPPAPEFYFAEAYHQQYLKKVPNGYCPNHATGVTLPADFFKSEAFGAEGSRRGRGDPEGPLTRRRHASVGQCSPMSPEETQGGRFRSSRPDHLRANRPTRRLRAQMVVSRRISDNNQPDRRLTGRCTRWQQVDRPLHRRVHRGVPSRDPEGAGGVASAHQSQRARRRQRRSATRFPPST